MAKYTVPTLAPQLLRTAGFLALLTAGALVSGIPPAHCTLENDLDNDIILERKTSPEPKDTAPSIDLQSAMAIFSEQGPRPEHEPTIFDDHGGTPSPLPVFDSIEKARLRLRKL